MGVNRRLSIAILGGIALLVAVGLSWGINPATSTRTGAGNPAASSRSTTPPFRPPDPTLDDITAVGQVVAVSYYGDTITAGLRHLILDDKVGTVLLFRGNFGDSAHLLALTAQLHELGREAGLPAPLLITLDEEGGDVNQVSDGIPLLPSAYELAAAGPELARQRVAATAAGLRRLGVDLDLAPVSDIRTNPADAVIGNRSFGNNAATVGPMVAATVVGLHQGGVGATLKHFPGLGGAAGDPHLAMPLDPISHELWTATDALTVSAGIGAGADCVMVTAVVDPGLDPTGTPALFSRPIVTGLLREQLKFRGVIVTDSLSMAGIGATYPLPVATIAAINAGGDLILLGNGDTTMEDGSIVALRQAMASGQVDTAAVRVSADLVIMLRHHLVRIAAQAANSTLDTTLSGPR